MPASLPGATRDFIARHIHSIEQLEILLLLHSQPTRSWSVDATYAVILSAKPSVERRLKELAGQGLLSVSADTPPVWRYAAQGAVAAEVDRLAALHKLKPVRVIEAIFARRGPDPLQGFADAFRLSPPPPAPPRE
jgi:hypothetical protein